MEAGLKEFIKAYAKDTGLEETDIALLAGALASDSIKKLPQYAHFGLTMNQVAPHLMQYLALIGKTLNE